jgi:hypothetical protein
MQSYFYPASNILYSPSIFPLITFRDISQPLSFSSPSMHSFQSKHNQEHGTSICLIHPSCILNLALNPQRPGKYPLRPNNLLAQPRHVSLLHSLYLSFTHHLILSLSQSTPLLLPETQDPFHSVFRTSRFLNSTPLRHSEHLCPNLHTFKSLFSFSHQLIIPIFQTPNLDNADQSLDQLLVMTNIPTQTPVLIYRESPHFTSIFSGFSSPRSYIHLQTYLHMRVMFQNNHRVV